MDLLPVLSRGLSLLLADGHLALRPQGGLCLTYSGDAVDLSRREDMEHLLPFRMALDGACGEHHFLGLRQGHTYTGLLGRRLGEGTVVYQPTPVSGTLETILANLPAQTASPVSTEPRSPHLLGFALSATTPRLSLGQHPLALDLEKLLAGFAVDAGYVGGKIRPHLRAIPAPFYGACTVPFGTLAYGCQGGTWTRGQPRMGGPLQAAFHRALTHLMDAHGVHPGDLAVAPHSTFQGHMLLARGLENLSAHERMELLELWHRATA